MKTSKRDFAVLLMAHGGPETLDDIPGVLSHIRHGRPLSQAFLTEVTDRYRLIGGSSPLLKICESLRSSLALALTSPVYLGMRHWRPFIKDTIQQIAEDGHAKLLGICLAPHYSSLSILEYQRAVRLANASLKEPLEIQFVSSWELQPGYIDFHVQEILAAKKCLDVDDWSQTCVMLTAHSLPSRILQSKDPYVDQLQQTVQAISKQLATRGHSLVIPDSFRNLELERSRSGSRNESGMTGKGKTTNPDLRLVFQSASPTGEPWLGPNIEEELERFAASHGKNVIISPIGFVAEHVEVLYDIDIVTQKQADRLGLKIKRTRMLNDRQEMVAILQSIVEESTTKFHESVVIEPTERYLA